jgi:hypothetical protein
MFFFNIFLLVCFFVFLPSVFTELPFYPFTEKWETKVSRFGAPKFDKHKSTRYTEPHELVMARHSLDLATRAVNALFIELGNPGA